MLSGLLCSLFWVEFQKIRKGEQDMETTSNAKGQIVIPVKIRKQLGIKDGTYLQVDVNDATRQIIITPITRENVRSLRGKYKGKGLMKALMAEKQTYETRWEAKGKVSKRRNSQNLCNRMRSVSNWLSQSSYTWLVQLIHSQITNDAQPEPIMTDNILQYESEIWATAKDAFEHFSDVVVSDFDPFGDRRVLEILYGDLKKSDAYEKFFERFVDIYKDPAKRDTPESYLAFEGSLEKHINANPKRTADTKAKFAQYFTILNRIEYVIEIEKKHSEPAFLYFWRKFNALYNTLNRSEDTRDPIEVYFDNQIGIIEVKTEPTPEKKKKETKVAQAPGEYTAGYKFDILKVIEARNAQEARVGELIQEFADKIEDLFEYVRNSQEGKRLIIKINSHVSEDEIYDDFAKIYRRYRALNRQKVGDYFFKETEDLVNKLCDDFEMTIRVDTSSQLIWDFQYFGVVLITKNRHTSRLSTCVPVSLSTYITP